MRETRRTISIRKLPQNLQSTSQRSFYRELESCINVDRPSVVLDCSLLVQLDRRAIHLLLCCLEEAMKRNGDVRLAALQPEARLIVKSTGLDSIFQVFDNISDAVESFSLPRVAMVSPQLPLAASNVSSANQDPAQANAA